MIPSPAILSVAASVTTGAGTAAIAASLPHDGSTFWFCSGFEITGGGATAGAIKNATITGLLGGTLTYQVAVPSGVTSQAGPLIVEFPAALPSVDVNTDVVLSMPSPGTGSAGVAIVLHGYKGAKQLNA